MSEEQLMAVAASLSRAVKEYNRLMAELKTFPVRTLEEQREIDAIRAKGRGADQIGQGGLSRVEQDERLERASATIERAVEMLNEAASDIIQALAKRRVNPR